MWTQRTQRLAQFVRGSVEYCTQLIGGLCARFYRRASGHSQHPDRLNGAVSLLGYPQRLTREHRPGGCLSVARVTFAVPASPLAFRTRHFADRDARRLQEPAQACPIATCAFNPYAC
jgi:hypothetical protein